MYHAAKGNVAVLGATLVRPPTPTPPALLNTTDIEGYTALHHASRGPGQPGCVRTLLAAGADPFLASTSGGSTPLHLASADGVNPVVTSLLFFPTGEGGFPLPGRRAHAAALADAKDGYGLAALHHAVRGGHVSVIHTLVAAGADVDAVGGVDRDTPLDKAVASANVHVVRILLEAGASTAPGDEEGLHPLHLAARDGQEEIVALLLEHGADPLARDEEEGTTALHEASAEGHEGVLCKLVGTATAAADKGLAESSSMWRTMTA
jgi:ankyrin repeat protein